eukprot:jgi/Bigna1/144796/aug1.91_g19504
MAFSSLRMSSRAALAAISAEETQRYAIERLLESRTATSHSNGSDRTGKGASTVELQVLKSNTSNRLERQEKPCMAKVDEVNRGTNDRQTDGNNHSIFRSWSFGSSISRLARMVNNVISARLGVKRNFRK